MITKAILQLLITEERLQQSSHELVTQLLIQQPEDPIVFVKQCIQHIIRKRDIPRVILIAPPSFDKMALAKILQEETGIRPVTLEDLYNLSFAENTCRCYDANEVAERMQRMLKSGILHESGWILVEDAEPCNYNRTLRGLREAYANLLIEVEAGTKTIQALGKDCATLMKIRKHYGTPSLFRIVLMGPRGSGRRSLAKYIAERFDLVHVDFNDVLEKAYLQETALSEMLRLCEHRCEQKAKSKAQILERYILGSDCLKRGWILTGYPKTAEEFKLLDMIPTLPNRVIILKVDVQTCRERLLNHPCYIITGSEHDLASSESSITDPSCKLDVYSNNYKDIVERDLRGYEENIDAIMQYAGETACIIDATGEEKCVKERLEACLMQPAPFAKPRVPQPPPTIDPMDIEFEPDDEPDPSIFDDIRTPEPKYSFI
ncbi:adenylate kinase 8 isoform X2 [Solenopsis invicta]|uniref:adenylate kinase 8 isoform X2 n=1 Tax=Solenopsis invicta TaxID=13686 RepID=UPI00193E597B|nr:adenylate kinase 8 isoform X2 [Solenopsis invicta]